MLPMRYLPFGPGVTWLPLRISVLHMASANRGSRHCLRRFLSSEMPAAENTRFRSPSISILGDAYKVDSMTNVTPRVANKVNHRLHRRPGHPLYHVRRRIENFFNSSFLTRVGTPRFAVFDSISPIVTPLQNFDSLLVPSSHPSRSPSDTYYINSEHLLRSHTTAHDADLIRSGLDAFLTIGDVYRRDEIDASHYPVFHQVDGVLLFSQNQVNLMAKQYLADLITFCDTLYVTAFLKQ